MGFEETPGLEGEKTNSSKTSEGNGELSEDFVDLKRKALELEKQNMAIEEMPKGEERDEKIEKADQLNEELARLEQLTGVAEDEIMNEYEGLTKEAAEKGIDALLEELISHIGDDRANELKVEVKERKCDGFLRAVKEHLPSSELAVAAACALMLFAGTLVVDVSSSHAEEKLGGEHYASLQVKSEELNSAYQHQEQAEQIEEATEKAQEVLESADAEVRDIIKNANGLVLMFAQKRVVDDIADSSQEIIRYLRGEAEQIAGLEDEAADIINVYKTAIEKVDQLGDEEASKKIREKLVAKVELAATKDYQKIKKEFLQI